MSIPRWSRRALLLAAALAVSACQQTPATPAVLRDVATPRMHAMPSGELQVGRDGSGTPVLHAVIAGLQPDSVHPVLAGSPGCGLGGKAVAGTLTANSTGHADASIPLPATGQPGVTGVVVAVGPGSQDAAEGAPLGCADVPPSGRATVHAAPSFSAARVTVEMTYDRATRILTVHVRASGLQPGTRHPNHIHTGQCELEGPVREVLHTLVADAGGRADATTPIPQSDGIRPGIWYVAVHSGPRLDSQAQYALLACGDVATMSTATS